MRRVSVRRTVPDINRSTLAGKGKMGLANGVAMGVGAWNRSTFTDMLVVSSSKVAITLNIKNLNLKKHPIQTHV